MKIIEGLVILLLITCWAVNVDTNSGHNEMSNQKKQSNLQENLLNLYLRLNGYFVTGFIAHSPEWGKNRAEIDALALRHPYHSEPERSVEPSAYIQTSSEIIDLVICEVKSKGQQLQFNESFRDSVEAIGSVLRWSGLFFEDEIIELANSLSKIMQPREKSVQEIPCLIGPRNAQIRLFLCSPERWEKKENQPWFIPGSEIFSYLRGCFNPEKKRDACSTRYDFSSWGEIYEPIVRYIKEKEDDQVLGNMEDLYKYLKLL